jgi:hypothetical protein
MARIKGTDLVSLKKLLKTKVKAVEEKFLGSLSENDLQTFKTVIATSWTPVEVQARIYLAAAHALYPRQINAVEQLHHELAHQTYSGIYSIFLKIPSLKFIISRVAALWTTYYDKGTAEVENLTRTSLDFIVRDFPDLPKELRDATTGHIGYLLKKIGNRNVRVKHIDTLPHMWQWHVTWD